MLRDLGIVDVDAAGVARVRVVEESHFLDAKSKDIAPAKLGIHATAFANSAGGEVYVGLDEDDTGNFTWRGFADLEEANAHIQVLHSVFQGNNSISVEFLRGAGVAGYILHLIIEKSREILVASDGKIYTRVSAQKLPVRLDSHEEIDRLKLDKGLQSYEDMPLPNEGIDEVTKSLVATEFMLVAIPVSEPDTWLRSQRLLVDDHPTVACLLIFSDLPQVILPKRSAIKITRYKTSDEEGRRDVMDGSPLTIEGCITKQIEAAVEETKKIIDSNSVQTAAGLQEISYPPETLHEIIANAVLHRDYSIATDIQIRIFDNRVEVDSPGRLPGHVTPGNVLDEQFARNGKIVRLVNKFPDAPNKDTGEGLNTAYQKMQEFGLKPPVLEEHENRVVVNIRHERLASYEEQILEYLEANPEINNARARQITGEGSENKMKRTFEKMMIAGQIYRDPTRRGSATAYLLSPAETVAASEE